MDREAQRERLIDSISRLQDCARRGTGKWSQVARCVAWLMIAEELDLSYGQIRLVRDDEPICRICRRYRGDRIDSTNRRGPGTCDVFPDGIPIEPYWGDHPARSCSQPNGPAFKAVDGWQHYDDQESLENYFRRAWASHWIPNNNPRKRKAVWELDQS